MNSSTLYIFIAVLLAIFLSNIYSTKNKELTTVVGDFFAIVVASMIGIQDFKNLDLNYKGL